MAARMAAGVVLLVLGGAFATGATPAQEPSPPAARTDAAPVVDMEAVVVTGVQPGPGMWRARRGGHTLYILGTQSPLPRGMSWDADEARDVLGQAMVTA